MSPELTTAEVELDALIPLGDVPVLPAEVLLSVHQLDLDTLIPAARRWRTGTRNRAARLLRQAAPMLRHLVAEIVTMDRLAHEIDDKLCATRDELSQLRAAAPAPSDDPITAAHAMALRLSQQLDPSPTRVTVERYSWESEPRVEVSIYGVAGAAEAWGAHFGIDLELKETASHQTASGQCTVDGVVVHVGVTEVIQRPAAVAS